MRWFDPVETLAPTDVTGVVSAVRDARERGLVVYPTGGGTALGFGGWPSAKGLELSLAGLAKIVDYPARDLTITVEPGLTLKSLGEMLAREGQWLPVGIPNADRATVGGAVSSEPPYPGRLRFGSLRDYVLGLSIVDGRGVEFTAGGRVVKNAAGYNLCRLYSGSLGTMGVITGVTLMVRPRPGATAIVTCSLSTLEEGKALFSTIRKDAALLSTFALLSGRAVAQVLPRASASPIVAVAILDGLKEEVGWMVDRVISSWRSDQRIPELADEAERDLLRSRLSDFPFGPSVFDPERDLVIEANGPIAATIELTARLRETDAEASLVTHCGCGTVVACCRPETEDPTSFLTRARAAVSSVGGRLCVRSYPPGARLNRDAVFGPVREEWRLAQRLKDRFDPQDILNRGRFIFGAP